MCYSSSSQQPPDGGPVHGGLPPDLRKEECKRQFVIADKALVTFPKHVRVALATIGILNDRIEGKDLQCPFVVREVRRVKARQSVSWLTMASDPE